MYIGARAFKIWRIISQNTIRRSITNKCETFTYAPTNDRSIGNEFEIPHREGVVIPQVRPAHKYPISPWETIHLPLEDNAFCATPHPVHTAVCNESLTATYQYKLSNPSNKVLKTGYIISCISGSWTYLS
jgi:hypothetical protein